MERMSYHAQDQIAYKSWIQVKVEKVIKCSHIKIGHSDLIWNEKGEDICNYDNQNQVQATIVLNLA